MFSLKQQFSEEAGADGAAGGGGAGGESGNGGDTGGNDALAWMNNLPDEDKAFVANKGWKDPANVIRGYRDLEKMRGVPAERLLRMPEDGAPQDEFDQFYSKLGRPDTPDGYEMPKEGDQDFQKWARSTFHKMGIPAKAAKGLIEAYNNYAAERIKASTEDAQFKIQNERRELEKDWGARMAYNEQQAARAAQALNMQPEQVDALENVLGHAGVMKMFHQISEKLSEDAFVGGNGGGSDVLTPAQAQMKIAELKSDKDFRHKLLNGDLAAKRKMDELHMMAYGKTG